MILRRISPAGSRLSVSVENGGDDGHRLIRAVLLILEHAGRDVERVLRVVPLLLRDEPF